MNGNPSRKLKMTVCCEQSVTTLGLQTLFAQHDEIQGRVIRDLDLWPADSDNCETEILLVDIGSCPDLGFLGRIKRRPNLRIVLWVDSVAAGVGFQALELGVRGILRKTLSLDELVHHLWVIAEGNLWIDKELRAVLEGARTPRLTTRESQLLELLAQGLKNKEIAWTLKLTENTIKAYMSRLFQKLGVKDRLDLALYGIKHMNAGESSHLRSRTDAGGSTRAKESSGPFSLP